MEPKVSVIIPCYNLGQYLEEAVESVLNQTFQDFEIIIINDGSTDPETNELLENCQRPKMTIYQIPNQGVSAARNFGIEKASGKYIACLDADDKYHPDFLSKTVKIFDKDFNKQFGIVTTFFEKFGESTAKFNIIEFSPFALAVKKTICM